jgi:hypothetical protein
MDLCVEVSRLGTHGGFAYLAETIHTRLHFGVIVDAFRKTSPHYGRPRNRREAAAGENQGRERDGVKHGPIITHYPNDATVFARSAHLFWGSDSC